MVHSAEISNKTDEEYAKDLAEYEELAGVLKVPIPTLHISLASWKPDTMPDTMEDLQEIERQFQAGAISPIRDLNRPGHSWCRNAYNLLTTRMVEAPFVTGGWGDGYLNRRDVDAVDSYYVNHYPFPSRAEAYGDDCVTNYSGGIYIGIGTTAETFNDYQLETPIEHGEAGGEMRCWDMWANQLSWNGGTRKFTITIIRYFTNHSGGSITVGEMAFIVRAYSAAWGSPYVLWARDVLSPTWAIADLELFRAQYDILTTAFPS